MCVWMQKQSQFDLSDLTSPVLTAVFISPISRRTDTANKISLTPVKKLVIVAQLYTRGEH